MLLPGDEVIPGPHSRPIMCRPTRPGPLLLMACELAGPGLATAQLLGSRRHSLSLPKVRFKLLPAASPGSSVEIKLG